MFNIRIHYRHTDIVILDGYTFSLCHNSYIVLRLHVALSAPLLAFQ